MSPETYEALITHLHKIAPTTPWEDVEAEFRANGVREDAIAATRLMRLHSDGQFDMAIDVVRIICGDDVAERLRQDTIERQREYIAND